jgi:4'-phosphopantetheinyl transferase
VTRGHAVGIDIERIRPEMAEQQFAERFFAPQEVTALRALPLEVQAVAFFDCWTRKEAFVKACGEGLSLPLDRFAVTLTPGQPAALLSAPCDSVQARRWQLWSLEPGPGYAAALAVDCPRCRVLTFRYSAAG